MDFLFGIMELFGTFAFERSSGRTPIGTADSGYGPINSGYGPIN
jgi:hypothetical protein